MTNSNASNLHRDRTALLEVGFTLRQNCLQQLGQLLATQALDANPNDGRRCGSIPGQQGMKIGVQSDDHTPLVTAQSQYRCILRSGQTQFTNVNRVDPRLA